MSVMTLNLGAGNRLLAHAINHDVAAHRPEIDIVHDLNVLPWPWKDCSLNEIVARSVFEHLKIDLVQSVTECWRLLRPVGLLSLKLPHWQSDGAHDDPTHRWFFSMHSLDQFDPDTERGKAYAFYLKGSDGILRQWRIVKGPILNPSKSSIHATLEVRK